MEELTKEMVGLVPLIFLLNILFFDAKNSVKHTSELIQIPSVHRKNALAEH
jgi:hypothetical protein